MYKIFCNNTMICDSRVEDLAVVNPKIDMEVNKAGYFAFTMPKTHPYRDIIEKRVSTIYVYRDTENEPIFAGDCVASSEDFFGNLFIECEGELSYLNDTIQRPAHLRAYTARQLLEYYIAEHNANCEEHKHFTVGAVTVLDDYITCFCNYESTLQCIFDDLVDDLGGYLRIRHEGGTRYLDYLAESPNTSTQIIKLGSNLMDIKADISTENIATVVIPLGASTGEETIEGLPDKLTIKSVNEGKDYLESTDAIANFGRIEKIVNFDDVTTVEALYRKGMEYLLSTQWESLTITADAVDLHIDNEDIESFKVLDTIRVVSKPHGLDKNFLISRLYLDLNNPASSVVTLGSNVQMSLSAKTASVTSQLKEINPTTILDSAKANASELIKTAQNGFIKFVTDENGRPTEMLIMDTNDVETAQKIWRWNQNGFGYSSTGYDGEYTLAMTMDGSIVADAITTGTMYADRISGGTLKLGGYDNTNGEIKIYDQDGVVCGQLNNNGLAIFSPTRLQQVIISPEVGFVMRDSQGDEYYGKIHKEKIVMPTSLEHRGERDFSLVHADDVLHVMLVEQRREYSPIPYVEMRGYDYWFKWKYWYTAGASYWNPSLYVPTEESTYVLQLPDFYKGKNITVQVVCNGIDENLVSKSTINRFLDTYEGDGTAICKADGTEWRDTSWSGKQWYMEGVEFVPSLNVDYTYPPSMWKDDDYYGNMLNSARNYAGTKQQVVPAPYKPQYYTTMNRASIGAYVEDASKTKITFEIDKETAIVTVNVRAISSTGTCINDLLDITVTAIC